MFIIILRFCVCIYLKSVCVRMGDTKNWERERERERESKGVNCLFGENENKNKIFLQKILKQGFESRWELNSREDDLQRELASQEQCDHMLESKVAQFFQKVAQNVVTAVLHKKSCLSK